MASPAKNPLDKNHYLPSPFSEQTIDRFCTLNYLATFESYSNNKVFLDFDEDFEEIKIIDRVRIHKENCESCFRSEFCAIVESLDDNYLT